MPGTNELNNKGFLKVAIRFDIHPIDASYFCCLYKYTTMDIVMFSFTALTCCSKGGECKASCNAGTSHSLGTLDCTDGQKCCKGMCYSLCCCTSCKIIIYRSILFIWPKVIPNPFTPICRLNCH